MRLFKRFNDAIKVVLMGGKAPPILRFMLCASALSTSAFAQSPVELTLSILGGIDREFMVGEQVPLELTFTNTSDTVLYVVEPLDGSLTGNRAPTYHEVLIEPFQFPCFPVMQMCGTVARLAVTDFIQLEPGESRTYSETNDYFNYIPKFAGRQTISYEVNLAGTWESYLGMEDEPFDAELKAMWDRIPQVKLVSHPVTIHVISNGKTHDPRYHCLMGMPYDEVKRIFRGDAYMNSSSIGSVRNPKYFSYPAFLLHYHLNIRNIIDGVELISNYSNSSSIDLAHLPLLRGGEKSFPERIEYEGDMIRAIRIGYYALNSGVNDDVFQAFR